MSTQPESKGPKWRNVLDNVQVALEITVLLVTAAVCFAMFRALTQPAAIPAARTANAARRAPEPKVPSEPVSLVGAQILGSKSASVAVLEYADPQCPYCAKFAHDTLPGLQQAYIQPGKVLLAYQSYPLESIHPLALRAAEAEECAAEQHAFWKMHDLTFGDQPHLDDATLRAHAKSAGVNLTRFDTCLAGDVSAKVRAAAKTGQTLAVSGTPTFFVGILQPDGRLKVTKRLSGALPIDQFKLAIDAALAGAPKAQKLTH